MVVLRCKVVVAGDATVGKTALVQMFQSKSTVFPKNYKLTAGVELVTAAVAIPREAQPTSVELYLFDTGGQDIFRDALSSYWNSVGMIMLVFDATSKETFDNCAMWLDMLKKHRLHKDRPLQGVLVSNKNDLRDRLEVSAELAHEWAQQNGLQFFEASASPPGRDVDAPFAFIAAKWHKSYMEKMEALASIS